MTEPTSRRVDRFEQAAPAMRRDDDEARLDERMKKLVKQKPAEKPE